MLTKAKIFFAVALIPFLYGCYLLYSVMSLPAPKPGQANCGTPGVVGLFFMVIVSPVVGTLAVLLMQIILWGSRSITEKTKGTGVNGV